jgi:hypothetical protein
MSRRKNRVLILGACYGSGNMGVDALLSGTIASILNKDPEAEISLLDFSRERKTFRLSNGQDEIEVR